MKIPVLMTIYSYNKEETHILQEYCYDMHELRAFCYVSLPDSYVIRQEFNISTEDLCQRCVDRADLKVSDENS